MVGMVVVGRDDGGRSPAARASRPSGRSAGSASCAHAAAGADVLRHEGAQRLRPGGDRDRAAVRRRDRVRACACRWRRGARMTLLILIGLMPFAAFGIWLGHVLTVDSMGPALGGIIALFALLGGAWGPVAGDSGFMHDLVRAAAVVLAGPGRALGVHRRVVAAEGLGRHRGLDRRLARLARRAYQRDTPARLIAAGDDGVVTVSTTTSTGRRRSRSRRGGRRSGPTTRPGEPALAVVRGGLADLPGQPLERRAWTAPRLGTVARRPCWSWCSPRSTVSVLGAPAPSQPRARVWRSRACCWGSRWRCCRSAGESGLNASCSSRSSFLALPAAGRRSR